MKKLFIVKYYSSDHDSVTEMYFRAHSIKSVCDQVDGYHDDTWKVVTSDSDSVVLRNESEDGDYNIVVIDSIDYTEIDD